VTGRALFTIGPGAPFLPTLAAALLEGTLFPDWARKGPFWLADITVFLPTRRARVALADALVAAMGDDPLLLPDIRALGGDDPEAEPFLPPFAEPPPPPAMPRTRRRLMLARLVEAWIASQAAAPFSAPGLGGFTGAPNPGEVLALADSLATLIDDFTIAGRSVADLGGIAGEDLPERWQDALDFVQFVFSAWPDVLAEEGMIEGAERTGLLLRRQAAALPQIFGDKPVVVAGSTGSIPATADLIAGIAALPRGAVVLPGLDRTLDTGFAEQRNPHGHPQYGLSRLVTRLGVRPEAVAPLGPVDSARVAAVRQALALADDTAHWDAAHRALAPALPHAFADVDLLVARNAEEEARAVALAVRDALARDTPERVAVITPDQGLSRRIAAELARFDIAVDDAAGTPLAQSRAGRLVRQVTTLAVGGCAAVDVMALLRHRHVGLGLGRAQVAPAAGWLDFGALRGQRPAPGLAGFRAAVEANMAGRTKFAARRLSAEDGAAVLTVLDALEAALAPLLTLFAGQFDLKAFAGALEAVLAALRAGTEDAGPLEGERELGLLLEQLASHGAVGPRYDGNGLALALNGLMAGASVRPTRGARADVAILGRLEARLISADLVILAGLVEGVWPEVADPGPWMSRAMRMAAGLEPPERLHGLAAHDFLMACGAPRLIFSRAARAGTSPAIPSRLVQRLEAFVGEDVAEAMAARGRRWVSLARRLDLTPGAPEPATRPVPRPALAARQKLMSLSVTEIETLFRSPYELYAKYVLGLRAIPPLGADVDAAERGSLIHDVFGRFIAEGHDPLAPEAPDIMEGLAREAFAALEAVPARRDIWLRRFSHTARLFLDFERARAHTIAARHAEIEGRMRFPEDAGGFVLRGRADRIDRRHDGRFEIIDFKTGTLPDKATMTDLLAPQLPLEAAMVAEGGFDDVGRGESASLLFVKIANGPEAFQPKAYATGELSVPETAEVVLMRLQRQVDALLLRDDLPLAARVLPNAKQRHAGDYDHFSRVAEWTLTDGGEDE